MSEVPQKPGEERSPGEKPPFLRIGIPVSGIPFEGEHLEKGELLAILAAEVSSYSLQELLQLRGILVHEGRHIPRSYMEKLWPYMREQVFGAHHRLLVMYRTGMANRLKNHVREGFFPYCTMAGEAISHPETAWPPRLVRLYYLLTAFTLFILDEPGHPVGTPFPGGLFVERVGDRVYCPVKEKEDEVEFAICPYCPALQTPHLLMG